MKAIQQALAPAPSLSRPDGQSSAVAAEMPLEANGTLIVPVVLQPVSASDGDTWAQTMRGLHGVIFVADSQPERFDENVEAMADLIGKLASLRIKIDNFPLVVQYNKRDVEGATSITRLEESINPLGLPAFAAVAKDGIGAGECFKALNLLIEKRSKELYS
jgi:hypothetical protein